MRHGRKSLTTALTSLAAVAAVGLVPASPSAAEPDVDDVQKRVDTLYREAEVASERYNDARIELKSIRHDLKKLKTRQQRQQRRLAAVQRGVEDSVVRQYQGEAVSGVSRVLVAEDPQDFVETLSAMDAYNAAQQTVFADFAEEAKKLSVRTRKTAQRAEKQAKVKRRLAADKAEIDEKAAEASQLLERLEAEERRQMERERQRQREAQVSRSAPRAPEAPEVQASGGAAAAVSYARAQVGDAYVYGAAGPDAFDCSGLTMMAWRAAGVSLPHSSSAQYSSGAKVSRSSLQPGDLVFYYQPISHVGIYVGNGQIVHAANPSTGVSMTSVDSMPYSGAVRPG